MNMVSKIIYERSNTDLSFLVFSKAFDAVNHRILSVKRTVLEVSIHLNAWRKKIFAARIFHGHISHTIFSEAQ